MAGEKTNIEAFDILEDRGMNAVMSYCAGDEFSDEKTSELWEAASRALEELTEYIEAQTGRSF
jgi:hypothetical protein